MGDESRGGDGARRRSRPVTQAEYGVPESEEGALAWSDYPIDAARWVWKAE